MAQTFLNTCIHELTENLPDYTITCKPLDYSDGYQGLVQWNRLTIKKGEKERFFNIAVGHDATLEELVLGISDDGGILFTEPNNEVQMLVECVYDLFD